MSVRAFVAETAEVIPGLILELDDDESHYLLKVRRLRVGASLELLDGRGGAWAATLVVASRRARVEVQAALEPARVIPERVVLLGLPEPAATLDALTCASELGATELILVACERSQNHRPSEIRIDRVLRAAMRQCGRRTPPTILGGPPGPVWTLDAALGHRPQLPGLVGDPGSGASLVDLRGPLRCLVGPEGGLTATEREAARAAGFAPIDLGPWILRTPTAVAALLARVWPGDEAAEGHA